MRITLDIDVELIKKVMKAAGTPSKKKAIEIATSQSVIVWTLKTEFPSRSC